MLRQLLACCMVGLALQGFLVPALRADAAPVHHLIKLNAGTIEPSLLTFKKENGIVFFLNNTKDALASLEIDFSGKTLHCNGTNLKAGTDEVVRSSKPLGPMDFATSCFHQAGTYVYKVYGLNSSKQPLEGRVVVE